MKVTAYRADDGSLFENEQAQKEHDIRTAVEGSIKKLSACYSHEIEVSQLHSLFHDHAEEIKSISKNYPAYRKLLDREQESLERDEEYDPPQPRNAVSSKSSSKSKTAKKVRQ